MKVNDHSIIITSVYVTIQIATNLASAATVGINTECELEIITEDEELVTSEPNEFEAVMIKSLELIKTVNVQASPLSVCHFNGSVCASLQNKSIVQINSEYNVDSFAKMPSRPDGVFAHNNRLYSLGCGGKSSITIYDNAKNRLDIWGTWMHPDHCNHNHVVIMSNQCIVPDRKNRCLRIYNQSKELVDSISLEHIEDDKEYLAMCIAGENSVAIANQKKVFKVDIKTRTVVWTCSDIDKPLGITCYKEKYLLVCCYDSESLHVVDIETGKCQFLKIANQQRKRS